MFVVEPDTDVGSEVAHMLLAIDREATATNAALTEPPCRDPDERVLVGAAEHRELTRQLSALGELAAGAQSRNPEPQALRSELATLLSFARILRSDAEAWRAGREAARVELKRQKAAARRRRERWLAEHPEIVRRREALQCSIDKTAEGLAHANGGECRRTVPVVSLGETLTVCSVTVLSPRRWFRSWKIWLVTVNDSLDEVLVRRC